MAVTTNHIDQILETVYRPENTQEIISTVDPIILRSWNRCVKNYHLEPSTSRGARILTQDELNEFKLPVEEFLYIAKSGLQDLYKKVNELDYVVLLTDKHGVTIDYIGNERFDEQLKSYGLYLGADWGEKHAGTCGVGICATEMLPVTAHHQDHFDLKNTSLTCSAAPIFDPEGNPLAVLDVSALNSPKNKDSQYLLLQIVKIHAQIIEAANFVHHFHKRYWIIRFGALKEYVNINSSNMLAVDETGVIHGMNSAARLLLTNAKSWNEEGWNSFIGKNLSDIFDSNLDFTNKGNMCAGGLTLPSFLKQNGNVVYYSSTPPSSKQHLNDQGSDTDFGKRPVVDTATNDATELPKNGHLSLDQLAGDDEKMQKSITLAKRLLDRKINFLIQGETGSGKEVFARALHQESERKDKPFIAVNCAAIPESLIESELFGYKPGTFTGARSKGMVGLIEQSSGGTLFLDEIGDMPLHLQTRLLRVLSEQEVLPLGSDKTVIVDLNVITATNKNIEQMIHDEDFREDLFFRIAGATISLQSLKDRKDREFIIRNSLVLESGDPNIAIEKTALDLLMDYDWPGNIRELRNTLRIAYALSDQQTITLDDLPDTLSQIKRRRSHTGTNDLHNNNEYLSEVCRNNPKAGKLINALIDNKWNITDTSKQLGISRATIYRKMKKFNIVMPNHL